MRVRMSERAITGLLLTAFSATCAAAAAAAAAVLPARVCVSARRERHSRAHTRANAMQTRRRRFCLAAGGPR
jgi:hypothetical protein